MFSKRDYHSILIKERMTLISTTLKSSIIFRVETYILRFKSLSNITYCDLIPLPKFILTIVDKDVVNQRNVPFFLKLFLSLYSKQKILNKSSKPRFHEDEMKPYQTGVSVILYG